MEGLSLPKWPQMKVTGVPVTREQALEIIRRTDTFFYGYDGNNHGFNKVARIIMHIPEEPKGLDSWKEYNAKKKHFQKAWGVVKTSYIHNSWISCSFIGGPNGWCHPDGKIEYAFNVGKWPEVKDIFEDWKILAKEFPFIDVGVTLMSGEDCEDETTPVVSMRVKDGVVTLVDPKIEDVHAGHAALESKGLSESDIFRHLTDSSFENAISTDILQEWSTKVWGS